MKLSSERIILLGLIVNILINIAQAINVELLNDEAYYTLFAERLDWGYFDHPPMVAIWIAAGWNFIDGELGVRLLTIFSTTAVLGILWRLSRAYSQNGVLFLSLCFSVSLVHIWGFLIVPDTPMIFFSALFLLLYKNYTAKDNWLIASLLGACISALLYSKYHGILLVFFTVLSNLSLLKRLSFWWIVVLSVALFYPHIAWQIAHDYPTLRYQLSERANETYTYLFVLNYLGSTWAVLSLLASPILLYAAFKAPIETVFERALKWNFIGILIFFGAMSFRGRVEAHWVAIAALPVLILSYKFITAQSSIFYTKKIYYLLVPNIVLLLLARIVLATNVIPNFTHQKTEFHYWKAWAKAIDSVAQGRPVAFINSYQNAAKYHFYTKNTAISQNEVSYRRNMFEIWDIEQMMQGKEVVYVLNWKTGDSIHTPLETVYYRIIPAFHSYNQTRVEWQNAATTASPSQLITAEVCIRNPYSDTLIWRMDTDKLGYTYRKGGEIIPTVFPKLSQPLSPIPPNDTIMRHISLQMPDKVGDYQLIFSLQFGELYPGVNSYYYKIRVE
jgi:hypothetical protein